jgi:hypothetical protein
VYPIIGMYIYPVQTTLTPERTGPKASPSFFLHVPNPQPGLKLRGSTLLEYIKSLIFHFQEVRPYLRFKETFSMKQALWLIVFVCFSIYGSAQSLRHKLQVGGTIHYNTSNSTSNTVGVYSQEFTTSKFQIQPSIGFFINDLVVVGLQANYQRDYILDERQSNSTSTDPSLQLNETELKAISWSVGPFLRYHLPLKENIFLFAHAGSGIGNRKQESYRTFSMVSEGEIEDLGNYYSTNNRPLVFANLKPGIIFFPVSKLGLEVSLGEIGYYTYGEGLEDKFTASLGFSSLHVGASLLIGK